MKTHTDQTKRTRTRTPNNKTTTAYRISDELWAVLEPLLPPHPNTHRFGGGRPRVPERRCADAIFYALRTGCQWQALDQTDLCAHSTAHDRYQAWVQADVFLKLWQAGVTRFDELKGLDWAWLSMDGAITKAPLGGEETGPNPTDRGKSGVKRSLLNEGHGVPMGLAVAGTNRTDMKLARPTLERVVVERPEPTPEHPQGCVWTRAMIIEKCATSWLPLASRPTSARGVKKLESLKRRPAAEPAAGWWNAAIVG